MGACSHERRVGGEQRIDDPAPIVMPGGNPK
jgi:hypothetical protein